jgi:general secretion pathway protein G
VLQVAGEPEVTPPPAPVLKPEADGRMVLKARDAAIHGDTAQYEEGNGKDNIGYWTNAQDWVSWDFTLDKAGKFEVEITYASASSAGAEYTLSIGKQELAGKTKDTGDWAKFEAEKLGTVDLEAGKQTLSVKPKSKPGVGVMNLKSVVLRAVQGAGAAPLDPAQIAAAKLAITRLESAVEVFEVDAARYPTTKEGLDALRIAPPGLAAWKGPYLRDGVPKDPWGQPYVYRCPGQHNPKGFDLSSAGPDGKEGTADDITNWNAEKK